MIKRQLNPLRIGKGLLCLLALFMMLLAPQGAWAQTGYGLTVAGVTVTSDNASNITSVYISGGTVSYDNGTHTLTLNGVNINGSVVVSSGFGDLVVKLVGNSVIQGTEQTSLTSGISTEGGSNGGKLTFEIDENTSGSLFFPYVTTPIKGFDNIEYRNGLEWGCRDEGTTTDYVEGVGTEVVLASIGASLYVTKTKTTMTLSNNGGTVTYRKDDILGHVLTLSGLTDLTNFISWYSPNGVTIEISGTNSMSFYSSGGSNAVCFDGKPQSSISFIFTGATATLKMYDRSQFKSLDHPWINGFSNASNPTLSDGLKMVEIDEYRYDNNQSLETYVERYITTETYGLNVKGTQVHHLDGVLVGHKDNILGLVYNEQSEKWELSTSVTFNSDDNILTLNNANINYDDGNAIVSSITSPLTVHLTGENSISSGHYLPFVGATGDNANLVFTTNATGTPGSLTMSSTHADFGPTQFFDGFKQVLYPEEQGSLSAKSVDGNVVISAEQETGYGLKVAGIVVTEDNASHILGDNNTTVTFNASGNILTLNGADFVGNIQWASANTLTVKILGNNIIDAAYSPFFQGNSNANLILTTNSDNPGDLHLTSCYSNNVMSGWKNNNSVYYNKETSSGAATDYGWWAAAISDQTKLRLNKVYDLWVDNVQLCDAQNEVSFDPEDYSGNRITYEDGKLKFQTVSKTTANSPFIVNGLGDLTILLVGNNTLNCGALFLGKKEGDSDHNVTFETSGDSSGHLVITTTGGENAWYTGHNAPTYEGLALVDEMKNNVRTLTISEPISYDLEVAGVSVTSANATNITGDYITGTVSFDASNNTLTLDGATIDLTEMEGPGISYTGTANLTISLIGTNSIKTQSACEPIICETQLDNKPTLTFERGSSLCSLELQTSGTDPVIRNFGNVLGVNGINEATGNVLKLDSEEAVAYTQENGLHTVQDNETTPVTSAKIVSVLKDPEFCFYVDGIGTISNGETKEYEYGLEQTMPELKRWDNGYLDLTGFKVTYTSSDEDVAIIDNTGKITIVGVGQTEIRASIEATGEYAADEAWFTMKVVPAVPKVSIPDGAYFTGQKLKITTDAQGGDLYYSYGYEEDESKRTPYVGEISLPAGEYQFYPYVRCGTVDNPIWSYTEATELYVYDEPTISKEAGEYEGDIEVEITNLPQPQSNNISIKVYYYLGDDDDNEENDILYKAGDKITVRESTKLNVYLLVEGDSNKYKTKVIEREYKIKDIPLDVTAADFHNHWMTYYHNNNGNVGLPEDQNIGAYVATTISGNEIVVTQIKSIPRGEPVLLNDETTTTTTNVFGQDVQGNLLVHATDDVDVAEKAGEGDFYGLYNGAFMHVKGTIPAGKNYLMVSNAVVPGGNAPQLTIVIDGEATGVNDVRSKMEDGRGDIYDLQGRKVQKPSKKGLYINKGHKVVIK